MNGLDLFTHKTQPINLSKKLLFSVQVLAMKNKQKRKKKKAYALCLRIVNNRIKDNIWVQHKEISPTYSVLAMDVCALSGIESSLCPRKIASLDCTPLPFFAHPHVDQIHTLGKAGAHTV